MLKIILILLSFSILTCCHSQNITDTNTTRAIYFPAPEPQSIKWLYPTYLGPETPMDPRPDELLATPINLDCPGVQIIEWRPSVQFPTTSGPSPKAIQALNEICKLVFDNFYLFAQQNSLTIKHNNQFVWYLCLMPGSAKYGGREPRNLNDHFGRFYARPPLDENVYYAGWTAHQRHKIFMKNDVLDETGEINPITLTVFAHELFHALSWYYGIFHDPEVDETLAQEFTQYLGLGV